MTVSTTNGVQMGHDETNHVFLKNTNLQPWKNNNPTPYTRKMKTKSTKNTFGQTLTGFAEKTNWLTSQMPTAGIAKINMVRTLVGGNGVCVWVWGGSWRLLLKRLRWISKLSASLAVRRCRVLPPHVSGKMNTHDKRSLHYLLALND